VLFVFLAGKSAVTVFIRQLCLVKTMTASEKENTGVIFAYEKINGSGIPETEQVSGIRL
jgi:hypothetical protein